MAIGERMSRTRGCWPARSPFRVLMSVGATRACPPPFGCAVTVRIGLSSGIGSPPQFAFWISTMNGRGDSITNFRSPRPMRRSVFSASGRFRSKIDGQGSDQSMHSAAVRQG